MTEHTPDAGTGPPHPPAYPDALRARLAVAQAACEVAELARAAVPVDAAALRPDGTARVPGATLAEAVQVLEAARRYVAAAADFERCGEPTAAAEERERTPVDPSPPAWWRAYTAVAPLEAALDLDDWVRRHADGDTDPGPAPVSGALAPHGTGDS